MSFEKPPSLPEQEYIKPEDLKVRKEITLEPLVQEPQENQINQELPPPAKFKLRSELGPDEAKPVELLHREKAVNPDNIIEVAPADRIQRGEKVMIDDSAYVLDRYDGMTGDVILKDTEGKERTVSQRSLYGQNQKEQTVSDSKTLEKPSFDQMAEKAEQRIENAKARFAAFKNRIKESETYQYAKQIGEGAVKAIAMSPEIVAYSRDFIANSPQMAKEAISNKIKEALNKAGIAIHENIQKIMDPAVEEFSKLEERARLAYEKFFNRKQDVVMTVEQQQKEVIEQAMNVKAQLDAIVQKAESLGMKIQFT